MALKKKEEKKEEFKFSAQARNHFAKEMEDFKFNFDDFLLSKGALGKRKYPVKGVEAVSIAVLRYETKEEQTRYITKHVDKTPYYSFEAITEESFWDTPYHFWSILREQSRSEEGRALWEYEKREELRTGKTREERAREVIAKIGSEFKAGLNKKI